MGDHPSTARRDHVDLLLRTDIALVRYAALGGVSAVKELEVVCSVGHLEVRFLIAETGAGCVLHPHAHNRPFAGNPDRNNAWSLPSAPP